MVHRVLRPAAVPARRRQRRPGRGDARSRTSAPASGTPTSASCRTALLAVRETHAEGDRAADVVNEIVRVAADGGTEVLVSGPDFVSDPRLAPDGVTLSWLQWDHPDMPWDAAQLVVRARRRHRARARRRPGRVRRPAGLGRRTWRCGSSATAPTSGRCTASGRTRSPSSSSTSAATSPARSGCSGRAGSPCSPTAGSSFAYGRDGADRLAVLEPDGSRARARRAVRRRSGTSRAQGTAVVCVAGGPASEPVVLRVDVDGGEPEILRPARDLGLDPAWFSRPEHVTFPTEDRRHRHRRRPRAGLPADQPGGARAGRATCRR